MEIIKKLKNKNFSSYQVMLIFCIGILGGQIFTIFDFMRVNEQYAVLQAILRSISIFVILLAIILINWITNKYGLFKK